MEAVREKERLVYRGGSRDFKSSFKCRELAYVMCEVLQRCRYALEKQGIKVS